MEREHVDQRGLANANRGSRSFEPDRLGRSHLPHHRGIGRGGVTLAHARRFRPGRHRSRPTTWCLIAGSSWRSIVRAARSLWTRSVHQGVPRVKRHVKASHASATPATNGKMIVAMFGSEGLFAFDPTGNELWRQDLGGHVRRARRRSHLRMGTGEFAGHSRQHRHRPERSLSDSFLIAFDLPTGKELWRSATRRAAVWTTPLVHEGGGQQPTDRDQLTAFHSWTRPRHRTRALASAGSRRRGQGQHAGRGGRSRDRHWRLSRGGPTDSMRFASAMGRSRGEHDRGSPYTSTPLVYEGLLYIVTDNGILSAYQVSDGQRVYQQRLSPGAGGVLGFAGGRRRASLSRERGWQGLRRPNRSQPSSCSPPTT